MGLLIIPLEVVSTILSEARLADTDLLHVESHRGEVCESWRFGRVAMKEVDILTEVRSHNRGSPAI